MDCYTYLNVNGSANHHSRINYEQKAPATQKIDLNGIIKKNISPPSPTKAVFIYPNRKERVLAEEEEYERVYAQFKDLLEVTDKGKIVAIDIDNTCIIGKDYDLTKIIEIVNNYDKSGRKYVRRIGKDKKVNVTIY